MKGGDIMSDQHDPFEGQPWIPRWVCDRCSQVNQEDTLKCVYCGLDYEEMKKLKFE